MPESHRAKGAQDDAKNDTAVRSSSAKRSSVDDDDKPPRHSQVTMGNNEVRRNLKWASFAKARVSFGFKHLSPAHVPSMTSEPRGIALCFDKLSGWTLPAPIRKQFELNNGSDYEIRLQLSMSMFHLNSSSFFGSTWMGPPATVAEVHSSSSPVEYTDVVYMISRITDPSCVAVVEIIVSKYDLQKNVTSQQFGCGWTMINPFTKPHPPDIAEGHENVSVMVSFLSMLSFLLSREFISNSIPTIQFLRYILSLPSTTFKQLYTL